MFRLFIVIALLYSGQVQAEKWDWYWSPRVGSMLVLEPGVNSLVSAGANVGLGLDHNLAVELESLYAFDGGEHEKGFYRIFTTALLLTYRFHLSNNFFVKHRLGLLYEQANNHFHDRPDLVAYSPGMAGGLAVGIYYSGLTLELEWTQLEQKISSLHLGLHYPFGSGI